MRFGFVFFRLFRVMEGLGWLFLDVIGCGEVFLMFCLCLIYDKSFI